jgi:hypothetical protein
MKAYAEIAVAFASALVKGEWVGANALLASNLRDDLSPSLLREQFARMFRGYSEGVPTSIHFDEQFTMEEWPDKQGGDAGWAYVSICGENFVEAVTVIVTDRDGPLLIRSVEWGRP